MQTGCANVIWQGDANAVALRALTCVAMPPRILNVTGPETVSIRAVAKQFGRLFDKEALFAGAEQPDAFIGSAAQAHKLFGYPRVPLAQIIEWVADWVRSGGAVLNKPTKFQTRDGKY